MRVVFSLLILTFIVLASTVVPVSCKLTHEPTNVCPDPWTDPIGYIECVIGQIIAELIKAIDLLFGGFKAALKGLFKGIGEGVASAIRSAFNSVAGMLRTIGGFASNISRAFHRFWNAVASLAARAGPFGPVVLLIFVLIGLFIIYGLVRIIGIAFIG